MLLCSLSGVACTTPNTSKSQPTAYDFAQLKQGTCLIRVKVDIRNPLRYLQDHKESSRKRAPPYDMSQPNSCFAAYQEWLVPLLISCEAAIRL